jgi:hypothetical protein
MLHSIDEGSSVMLHLALKAFHPAPLPFALLHLDTTWKFREMIAFRDDVAKTPQLQPSGARQHRRRRTRYQTLRPAQRCITVVRRGGARIMVDDARMPLDAGERLQLRLVRFRHPRLLSADRRHRIICRNTRRHRRRDAECASLRAAGGA